MLNKEDLRQAQDLIESFKPRVTYFEQKILVPNVRDRLKYVIEIFKGFKGVAMETGVATHIDAALRAVVNPEKIDLKGQEPKVGEQYLSAINRICDQEYIKPVREILDRFPLEDTTRSIESTTEFLNVASNFFQTIISTKDRPFSYMLRAFINIRHTPSGQVLLGPPQELTLILMPFQTGLNELVSVAESTVESIKLWGEQISLQKSKHVEIIAHLSQVKAAEQQAQAAKYNMYFQVAVIFFTIILVVGAEKAGLYLEKREMEAALTKTEEKMRLCSDSKTGLLETIRKLQAHEADWRTQCKPHPKEH